MIKYESFNLKLHVLDLNEEMQYKRNEKIVYWR